MTEQVLPGESLPRFPWQAFADGRYWRARQGHDFSCSPSVFRRKGWKWATKHRRQFVSKIDHDIVIFCIYKTRPEGSEPMGTSAKRSIVLPCGHRGIVQHTQGDRLVHCKVCANECIVTATIHYEIGYVTRDRGQGEFNLVDGAG